MAFPLSPQKTTASSSTAEPAPTRSSGATAQPAPAQASDPKPLRILVVEDSPVNRKMVLAVLRRLGFEALTATHGLEALEVIRRTRVDLILMDVEMPEMDGPTATRELRRLLPRIWQPVVVALTAHSADSVREQLAASGMDEFLTKPVQVGEIAALLERLPALKVARQKRHPRL
jgi:CheY-like chemotaxis protein